MIQPGLLHFDFSDHATPSMTCNSVRRGESELLSVDVTVKREVNSEYLLLK